MAMLDLAASCPLFSGIEEGEIQQILSCAGASLCTYEKGEVIESFGCPAPRLGIALSGHIVVASSDASGGRVILTTVEPRGIFGLFSILPGIGMEGTEVIAAEKSEALLLDEARFLYGCSARCRGHQIMLQNTIVALTQRNMMLIRKQRHMAQHSLRRKLLSYLTELSAMQQSCCVELPMNRQELADFLGVDRSAMCAELSRMQKDGLIEYQRKQVTIQAR